MPIITSSTTPIGAASDNLNYVLLADSYIAVERRADRQLSIGIMFDGTQSFVSNSGTIDSRGTGILAHHPT